MPSPAGGTAIGIAAIGAVTDLEVRNGADDPPEGFVGAHADADANDI